ncbi:flagellar brake protein [Lederbergia graminis]|uniref:Flagellar brake protein n=1 Tax=Lederbergia graminis TaxID=735518 RepID=A0ABW0LEH4_9BACI
MFTIGMEIIIELSEENQGEKLKATIEDYNNDKLYISYPIGVDSKKTKYLITDELLHVNFVHQETHVAYTFQSQVIGREMNSIPLLVLTLPPFEQMSKIQRRQFVRVEASLDISLQFVDTEDFLPTTTFDISAGGCSAILPNDMHLNPGVKGNAYIIIPSTTEPHYMKVSCQVIRTFTHNKINLVSLQFSDISKHDQQLIIRYCFEKQLEYRKKGVHIE